MLLSPTFHASELPSVYIILSPYFLPSICTCPSSLIPLPLFMFCLHFHSFLILSFLFFSFPSLLSFVSPSLVFPSCWFPLFPFHLGFSLSIIIFLLISPLSQLANTPGWLDKWRHDAPVTLMSVTPHPHPLHSPPPASGTSICWQTGKLFMGNSARFSLNCANISFP